MGIALLVAVVTGIGTWVIATNNLFGLKDRAVEYLRSKLGVSLEDEIKRRHMESDRELLNEIRDLLPSDYPINKLRHYDFGGVYRDELPRMLRDFLRECEKPEFEFHDAELEPMREELERAAEQFSEASAKHAFYLEGSTDKVKIPDEWHHKYPDKWHEARDQLNDSADKIVEAYDELVRLGRGKLGAK